VTLRIEKDSDGQTTTLRLIGRMRREHIEELKAQIKAGGTSVTLDLNEVSLVDVDVIRFLAAVKYKGSPSSIVPVISRTGSPKSGSAVNRVRGEFNPQSSELMPGIFPMRQVANTSLTVPELARLQESCRYS
jgi:hypothetical protein